MSNSANQQSSPVTSGCPTPTMGRQLTPTTWKGMDIISSSAMPTTYGGTSLNSSSESDDEETTTMLVPQQPDIEPVISFRRHHPQQGLVEDIEHRCVCGHRCYGRQDPDDDQKVSLDTPAEATMETRVRDLTRKVDAVLSELGQIRDELFYIRSNTNPKYNP